MRDRIALALAAVTLAFHMAFANRYDLFRDELYFIVCGQHPAFATPISRRWCRCSPPAPTRSARKRGSCVCRARWLQRRSCGSSSRLSASSAAATARPGWPESQRRSRRSFSSHRHAEYDEFRAARVDGHRVRACARHRARRPARPSRRRRHRRRCDGGEVRVAALADRARHRLATHAATPALSTARTLAWRRGRRRDRSAFACVASAARLAVRRAHPQRRSERRRVAPLAYMLNQVLILNPLAAPLWIAGCARRSLSRNYAGSLHRNRIRCNGSSNHRRRRQRLLPRTAYPALLAIAL